MRIISTICMLLTRILIYKVRADTVHLHLMTNTGFTLRHSGASEEKPELNLNLSGSDADHGLVFMVGDIIQVQRTSYVNTRELLFLCHKGEGGPSCQSYYREHQ